MAWDLRGVRSAGSGRQVAVVAVLAAAVLAGCTAEEAPGVASAGTTPTATTTVPEPQAQELAFVACMREQSIVDMPDPVPGDTSGRSAVRYALDVMGKGSDPVFQAALAECLDRLPEPPAPEPRSSDELEALREFAQCMRGDGLSDFPDLDGDHIFFVSNLPDADSVPPVSVDGRIVAVNLADPVVSAAWEACRELYPASDEGRTGE